MPRQGRIQVDIGGLQGIDEARYFPVFTGMVGRYVCICYNYIREIIALVRGQSTIDIAYTAADSAKFDMKFHISGTG